MPPSCHAEQVEAQLEKVLASAAFRGSRRRRDLLAWSVRRALAGDASPVKEYQIGLEVFGKPESWDPRVDPAVRVEFNRLRQKLRDFYGAEGKDDPVLIEFPHRGYVPEFRGRPPADAGEDPVRVQPAEEKTGAVTSEAEIAEAAFPADTMTPARTFAPEISSGPRPNARLRWALAVAAATVLIATGLWFRQSSPPTSAQTSSVAVLPFVQSGPGAGDDYLSYGFADELSNRLAGSNGLRVAARGSAFQFKGRNDDVRKVGQALQVATVVEGSIIRSGTALHITARLNRTGDGAQLWSASFDREMKDMVQVEDQIARSVASTLHVKLDSPEQPRRQFALDARVHDEYLRGAYEAQKSTPESLKRAIGIFDGIVRAEPRYAPALVTLGRAHLDLAGLAGGAAREEMTKAKAALEKGIALDPAAAQAHADLAYVNYVLDWNWGLAESHFQQAIRLAPGAGPHEMYGFGLMTRGRFAEAETQFRGAIERDPLNQMTRLNFATVLDEEGRSKEAMEQVRFCLDKDPNWFPALLIASYTAIYEHQPDDALNYLAKAGKLVPDYPLLLATTAAADAELGRKTEAATILKRIEGGDSVLRYFLAVVEGLQGDPDRVFYWLEQSAERREQQILYIRVEPLLAPYRGDPRMIALEKQVGL